MCYPHTPTDGTTATFIAVTPAQYVSDKQRARNEGRMEGLREALRVLEVYDLDRFAAVRLRGYIANVTMGRHE